MIHDARITEEEAVRRARFPARHRDRFLTHWRTKVLGNPTGRAQTASVRLLERCGFRRVGTEHDGDVEFAVLKLDEGADDES
jgi:hypothetical protein